MPNEHAILSPIRKKKLRAVLRADDKAPEVAALWAVLYGYASVDLETAQAVEAECTNSDRTVGDVLEGWRPDALAPKKWHADGCPGSHACNCGGGLTDAQLGAKMKQAWDEGK